MYLFQRKRNPTGTPSWVALSSKIQMPTAWVHIHTHAAWLFSKKAKPSKNNQYETKRKIYFAGDSKFSADFEINLYTGGEFQLFERFNCVLGGFTDINKPLMDTHLELFARFFVNMG
jgi:hypothetical protein